MRCNPCEMWEKDSFLWVEPWIELPRGMHLEWNWDARCLRDRIILSQFQMRCYSWHTKFMWTLMGFEMRGEVHMNSSWIVNSASNAQPLKDEKWEVRCDWDASWWAMMGNEVNHEVGPKWVGTTNSLLTGGTISRTFENWAFRWVVNPSCG